MTQIVRWIVISTLLLFLIFITFLPDKNLHIVACDIGQGDAILIYKGFSQILIDGGPSEAVEDCLIRHIPWYDRQLELVVLTHPQADHMKGLIGVVEHYDVELLVANNVSATTQTFETLHRLVLEKNIRVVPSTGSEIYRVGELEFKSLWPREDYNPDVAVWSNYNKTDQAVVLGAYDGDLNQTSIVLELSYLGFSALFTGDLGSRQEQALVTLGVIRPVNVLKIAHHGSKYSSDLSFLEVTRPKWAIISVGKDNRYGHPHGDILRYLDMVDAMVLRTDTMGEIELVTDGSAVWVD